MQELWPWLRKSIRERWEPSGEALVTAAGESRGTVDGAVGKACHAGRSVCPPGPAHLHFGQLTSMVVPRVMMVLVVAA